MAKRITNVFQLVEIGDYILNEDTGETWFSVVCDDCGGTGNENERSNYVYNPKCQTCNGRRWIWK